MRFLVPLALLLAVAACTTLPEPAPAAPFTEWQVDAEGLPAQRITVWVPPEYAAQPRRRFPVLYMWDGQNLFDPARTHYGKAWMVQDVLTAMVAAGRAEPHIVVGIHSPPGRDRYRVYLPRFAADGAAGAVAASIAANAGGAAASDRQLAWVADVLKPRVDRTWRTRPAPADTTVVGASMGGIMACYAAIARPDIFGRAGCVSAHFALVDPDVAAADRDGIARLWSAYLSRHLGTADGRRIWMDHGTAGLDAGYAQYQADVAAMLTAHGWREGKDFTARVVAGAEHDELAWRERMPDMLAWLWRDE